MVAATACVVNPARHARLLTNLDRFGAPAPFTAGECVTTVTGMFRSLEHTRRRARERVGTSLAAALTVAISALLGGSVAVADEPTPSDQTTSDDNEQTADVAVGLPPVPTETVPDASPETEPSADVATTSPAAPAAQVAVGEPPIPSFSVPDAVALSLW